jgi:hypothetical protein
VKQMIVGFVVLFAASVSAPANAAAKLCGAMRSTEVLKPGESVKGCIGKATLIHRPNGNVALTDYAGGLWNTNTAGQTTNVLAMQGDGNLVLYASSGAPLWHSQTGGNPGAWLAVQDD